MQEVKSINIVPTCVVVACVSGIIAVITGLGLFVGGLAHGHVASGLFGLFIRPLIIFAGSILATVVSIWLYNMLVPYVGGIEFEVGEK